MKSCETPIFLAYFMAAYLMASILYLALTANIGTPFKDSLSLEQLKIKRAASKKRSRVFLISFILSGVLLVMSKPFKECMDQ